MRHVFGLVALGILLAVTAPAFAEAYLVGVGDKLRVTVYSKPALSGEFRVRDDGAIAIPFVGDVPVAGRSLLDLENELRQRMKAHDIVQPVAVEIIEYRPFFVLGDVRSGGSYPYEIGMTVLHAVALAGGFRTSDLDDAALTIDLVRAREHANVQQWAYWEEVAREARLRAEAERAAEIEFSPELLERGTDPQIASKIEGERRIFAGKRSALENKIGILTRQIAQLEAERSALEAQAEAKEKQARLLDIELKDTQSLYSQGLSRKAALSTLQRLAAELEGDRRQIAAMIAKTEQGISSVELEITAEQDKYINDAVAELQKSRARLTELGVRVAAAREAVRQSELRLGRAQAASAAAAVKSYAITRRGPDGNPITIAAEESTTVRPGDIVRVYSAEATPGGTPPPPIPPVAKQAHF